MATNIYLITELEKNILINSENDYIKFRPIQDINNNYFISENEYFYIVGLWYLDLCPSELVFVKDLVLTVYEPKPNTNTL